MKRFHAVPLVLLLCWWARAQTSPTEPPSIVWNYSTPENFQFVEPAYRFPLQVKQALMKYVSGRPKFEAEFDDVFMDPLKFKPWILRILSNQIKSYEELKGHLDETAAQMTKLYQLALAQNLLRDASRLSDKITEYGNQSVDYIVKKEEAERLMKIIKIWADQR